jgi:hypothetical protein
VQVNVVLQILWDLSTPLNPDDRQIFTLQILHGIANQ